MCIRSDKHAVRFLLNHIILLLFITCRRDRCRVYDRLFNRKIELTTLSIFTFYFDHTAHHIDEILGNRKTKSRSFYMTVAVNFHTLEGIEKNLLIFLTDSDSGIFHLIIEHYLICVLLSDTYRKMDRSLFCILNGIVHKIRYDLADTSHISLQGTRNIRINIVNQFKWTICNPVF